MHQIWWSPQLIGHIYRRELIGLFCMETDEKMVYGKTARCIAWSKFGCSRLQ